ncbi:MAG: M56 family metallopeptidase [Mucilaginibacter sp.]
MIPYILHVALLISVCLLFYKIFLQKETFYGLNRVVLLICLGLSFALPLISIPQAWTLRGAPMQNVVSTPPPPPITSVEYRQEIAGQVQKSVQKEAIAKLPSVKVQPVVPVRQESQFIPIATRWLFYLYWAGVAAFGLNLLVQVVVLLYRSYSNPVIMDGKFRIIEVKGDKAPCSFGNNIFINPEKYDWETYNQILMHEKVHIEQGHSFDILLAELVLVFQWFNPFAWLYRGELENNLEFLTDEAVLDHNEVEKSSYQMSLLKVSAPHLALSVTTNYNQSLLKKRIVMMNAKKSNIHTMWKYFILVPLMGGLACALNQTVALGQTKVKTSAKAHKTQLQRNWNSIDRNEGSWFATIKGEKVRMEFRSDDDDRNWSSNDDYLLNEFSALPKDKKGEFTLKREAGTMLFNGKFDGDKGYGHYKFTANKEFSDYLNKEGITGIEDGDRFAFFSINITREYVEMLKQNGYGHMSKNELISMAALKVDAPYIKSWRENGFKLSSNELVSAKALGVNNEYISDIRNAGYPNISYNQLISFKAQGITPQYIKGLRKANLDEGKGKSEGSLPSAEDISSYKALNVDSNYIQELKNAGYSNVPFNELTSMKAVGVTPEYVKSFAAIGYKDIPTNELVSFKSLGITPEFVKSFTDVGYNNISANELMSLKALGITPNYVKGFEALGYKDISLNELTSFKSLGVTSDFIKSFEAIGYRQISPNELTSLKALGVTPGFIKGFKDIGFHNISLNEATSLKATGVTPAYVSSMKAKGFTSKNLDKYIQLKNAFN